MSFLSIIALASYANVTRNTTFPAALGHGVNTTELHRMYSGQLFKPNYPRNVCASLIEMGNCLNITNQLTAARSVCQNGPVCIQINNDVAPAELLVDVNLLRSNFAIPYQIQTDVRKFGAINPSHLLIKMLIKIQMVQ